jgi:phospholipid-transporting ATPase
MTKVIRGGKFFEVSWSEVVVGDIVLTEAEEMFPADLILIASSEEGGAAFIETASLDGEKNLKPRSAFKVLIPFNTE